MIQHEHCINLACFDLASPDVPVVATVQKRAHFLWVHLFDLNHAFYLPKGRLALSKTPTDVPLLMRPFPVVDFGHVVAG